MSYSEYQNDTAIDFFPFYCNSINLDSVLFQFCNISSSHCENFIILTSLNPSPFENLIISEMKHRPGRDR